MISANSLNRKDWKMRKTVIFVLLAASLPFFTGCDETSSRNAGVDQFANLNVTILVDLSDRISAAKNIEQIERDVECIKSVVHAFKSFVNTKGTVHSEDRIKVVFYPNNLNSGLENIASALSINFGETEFQNRRGVYDAIDSVYSYNLERLYSVASSAGTFNGSDIYNYFRHRVADDCIDERENFRNILVILSDGYMYHKNSMVQSGNRYSYILPGSGHMRDFSNNTGYAGLFERENYGFINTGNRLSKLSVLALEFAPYRDYAFDYDIQKLYWEKWFSEQGIERGNFKIVKSDLSALNKPIIKNFILKMSEGK